MQSNILADQKGGSCAYVEHSSRAAHAYLCVRCGAYACATGAQMSGVRLSWGQYPHLSLEIFILTVSCRVWVRIPVIYTCINTLRESLSACVRAFLRVLWCVSEHTHTCMCVYTYHACEYCIHTHTHTRLAIVAVGDKNLTQYICTTTVLHDHHTSNPTHVLWYCWHIVNSLLTADPRSW